MADWDLIIDDETFPDAPPATNEPFDRHDRWRRVWVVGTAVIFLEAGFVTVRSRRAGRQTALRVDLTAQIFAEEAAWPQPDESRIPSLIIPDPPQPWQENYRRLFTDTEQPAINMVDTQSVDFKGRCALVVVALNKQEQLRNYCLHEGRWPRALLPEEAWGAQQSLIQLPQGIRLR